MSGVIVAWNDTMSVGLSDIDDQHKQLIQQINQLAQAMGQGKARAEIEEILDFLGGYATQHFAAEERHFDRLRCPAAQANRLAHQRFVTTFSVLREQVRREGASAAVVVAVKRELSEWLTNHIMTIDRQLEPYVKRAGS